MMSSKPLAGVRVLDLTRLLPGPLCAQHLADLGADVIKIEDRSRGDYVRPTLRRLVNRNKRGLRLDLKNPEGKTLFLRLVRNADVLIEGFRPGVMARLGLGYETLRAENPKLIYCAITGYGQDGPDHDLPGHDLNYAALTGIVDDTGRAGDPPALSGFLLGDILGGTLQAAMGILAALYDMQRTGKGRFVDVAMADGLLAHNVLGLANLIDRGQLPPRGAGTHTGGVAHYGLYETRDGRYIAVAAQEKRFWDELCEAIGRSDLKDGHGAPATADSPVRRALEETFAAHPLAYWRARLEGRETCATPVLTLAEALEHEQFRARDLIQRNANGEPSFAFPVKLSDFEFTVARSAPEPGEHTEEILREVGLDSAELDRLRAAGAI